MIAKFGLTENELIRDRNKWQFINITGHLIKDVTTLIVTNVSLS